jgi:seryl-tRNA synthetase
MLDVQFILKNPEQIKQACRKKNVDPAVVDRFLKQDKIWKECLQKAQELRAKRNTLLEGIKAKPDAQTIAQGKKLKEELSIIEKKLVVAENQRQESWLWLPNVPSEDTPAGNQEDDKLIIRHWGEIPKFDFVPQDHLKLGQLHRLIDVERGAKVAGFRGYFLQNEAVLLQQAILNHALHKLVQAGFTPFIPPTLTKKRAFINTGHFPWGEKEAYQVLAEEDKVRYLTGTAEVGMVSFHQDEVLAEQDLPLKYVAISPCYRREIGSYGKDTKGLYRLHEFMKVEQVVFCQADLTESQRLFEEITNNAEQILQDFELPYRVCQMPAGDMGEPQYKKYDIETWMPSRESYGETMSCSQLLDFQSRRANIRYQTKDGRQFVYTLNNTALASPRLLIALLEVHQQKDGSIRIPKVLQPMLGKDKIS